ncbi:MAG: 3-deoxy-D-manno-octulosonic acid transferase, partial [Deltaproteobacteria bacterium]|nr:3-deoxy-D-manno-octulosonic acid transferase [Deltaproteobacteria bacterium]
VDTGGHNLLEPAMYSKPVLFGTHLQSYKYMAEMLENAGGGIMITEDTLKDVIIDILKDNDKAASIGQAALSVVTNNTGATDKAYNIISKILFNNDN